MPRGTVSKKIVILYDNNWRDLGFIQTMIERVELSTKNSYVKHSYQISIIKNHKEWYKITTKHRWFPYVQAMPHFFVKKPMTPLAQATSHFLVKKYVDVELSMYFAVNKSWIYGWYMFTYILHIHYKKLINVSYVKYENRRDYI